MLGVIIMTRIPIAIERCCKYEIPSHIKTADGKGHGIVCMECGNRTPLYDNWEDAIYMWNRWMADKNDYYK